MGSKITNYGDNSNIIGRDKIDNSVHYHHPAGRKQSVSQKGRLKGSRSFISVATDEAAIAEVLQRLVNEVFYEASPCFVSANSLHFGDRWLEEVEAALTDIRVFFVLFSKDSFTRHWLHFESGTAWIRKIPIFVLTHSGLKITELPAPYNGLQGGALDQRGDIERLIEGIATQLGRPEPTMVNVDQLLDEVNRAKSSTAT